MDTNPHREQPSPRRRGIGLEELAGSRLSEVSGQPVSMFDRWLMRALMRLAGRPSFEVRLWDDRPVLTSAAGDAEAPTLRVRSRQALWKLLQDAELHFGDLYGIGQVEVEGDLVQFLERLYTSQRAAGRSALGRLAALFTRGRRQLNSVTNARDHIRHHYDLGNDFYRLWLDREAMQYTCAYFPRPEFSIEQAQQAKLHHICRKLRLRPGLRVAEAGCGWGGLARFMAREYGVSVKAYNISHEQVSYARQQALKEGVAERVEYVEDDYRNLEGEFDVFVSVGMLEHVGPEHYVDLGKVIDRCLLPHGMGLIHTIGRNQPALMNAWIERRIFPGAHPPSLWEMAPIFQPHGFSVLDVENLRLHYARTLRLWMDRFDENADTIRAMYDAAFVRAWRLYLAGSVAAFTTGALQLFQVLFARPQLNDLPWSRSHLYTD